MTSKPNSARGRCFCGAVRFELTFPTETCNHCHCESCRRSHGSAFVTWTSILISRFQFLEGAHLVSRYNSSADVKWGFCSRCGSSFLYEHSQAPDRLWIAAASLIEPLDRQPDSHVSFEEHVNWLEVNDELPRYLGKSQEKI